MGSWMSTPWRPETGVPDLSGKVAVVTGANTGIGYEVAAGLARHGAKVYIASRTESKALKAIERLHAENRKIAKGSLVYLPLDLAKLDDVVKATETLLTNEERLDILVNNAGLARPTYETTPEGFEVTMAVNHLAHFLFTVNLLPLLKKTATKADSDVRIVTVSSSGHAMMIPANLRFDKLDDFRYHGSQNSPPEYAGTRNLLSRYAFSKLANVLFCKELQRQLDARNVSIISTTCNPGGTNTDGGMSVWPWWVRPIMSLLFVAPYKGAAPVLYLSSAPEIKQDASKYKAQYFNRACKIETPSALAQDEQAAKNLWKISEEAVKSYIRS